MSVTRHPEAPLVGSLLDTPLPRLLLRLHRDRFSGLLTLAQGAVRRRFEWRGGQPVGVSSPVPLESLCEALAHQGALDPALRRRVGEAVTARGCTELQALAQLGVVPPRALVLGLVEQLRRTLRASLGGRSGEYRLEPSEANGSRLALPFDWLAVLFEGVSAAWRSDEVLVALGERATQHPTLAVGFRAHWLPGDSCAQALLPRLDGSTPAFALLRELAASECAAALWLLDELGALSHADAPTERAAPEPAEPTGPRIEIVVRGQARAAAGAPRRERKGRPAAAPASVGEALRREILELHGRLRELRLFELLGVAPDAAPAELRRAYLSAAKRLHPDRIVRLGLLDLKDASNDVFAEIARAYEVLSDPEQRQLYEETLGDPRLADAERIAEAEASFVRGDHLLRAGNFRGALEFLERAVALWPDEADYQAALGWALHRKAPSESQRAFGHFERAFALGTEQAVCWLRASLVARELGLEARAAELAARARALDPEAKA